MRTNPRAWAELRTRVLVVFEHAPLVLIFAAEILVLAVLPRVARYTLCALEGPTSFAAALPSRLDARPQEQAIIARVLKLVAGRASVGRICVPHSGSDRKLLFPFAYLALRLEELRVEQVRIDMVLSHCKEGWCMEQAYPPPPSHRRFRRRRRRCHGHRHDCVTNGHQHSSVCVPGARHSIRTRYVSVGNAPRFSKYTSPSTIVVKHAPSASIARDTPILRVYVYVYVCVYV